ncbi:TerB family tellurite resistance protein [soil metagenome]
MLESLKILLEPLFGESPPDDSDDSAASRAHALEVATAALMIEMARADFETETRERDRILSLLKTRFQLGEEDGRALLELAAEKTHASASLHEFTQVLHARLRHGEKTRLMEMLWEVALADGRADKHEEALIRKVGDLLYVPRPEQARVRVAALSAAKR